MSRIFRRLRAPRLVAATNNEAKIEPPTGVKPNPAEDSISNIDSDIHSHGSSPTQSRGSWCRGGGPLQGRRVFYAAWLRRERDCVCVCVCVCDGEEAGWGCRSSGGGQAGDRVSK
ncbi:hypothetical protein LZ31DRAFT_553351 [Colletotrichum somersetense]|nr:hypothetical protein LZ31DRAFT_553351 [Colletotrichum somersetense]